MAQLSTPGTPLVLACAQLKRNTPAEVAQAETPWREASLELWCRRNAVLDAFFYDLKVIHPLEAAALAPWLAREGALLIVSACASWPRPASAARRWGERWTGSGP